jgi:uncharacterized membrane protein
LLSVLLLSLFGVWLTSLTQRSIWADEQATIKIFAAHDIPSVVSFVAQSERRPPLYFILLWLWSGLAGTREFALRYFSLWFTTLTVPLTYALARQLRNLFPALPPDWPKYALLLSALSPVLALYGVMLRYYAPVICLATLLLYLGVRWLRNQQSGNPVASTAPAFQDMRYIAAWLVVASILIYTDYSVLALVGAQLVWLFLQYRQLRWALVPWAVAALLLAVLFLPQLSLLREQASGGTLDADLSRSPLGVVLRFAYPAFSFSFGETIFPWQPLALLAMPFVGLALVVALRSFKMRCLLLFCGLIVLLPLSFNAFIFTVVATDLTFLTAASRTLYVLPAYLILLSASLAILPARWRAMALGIWGAANLLALFNLLTGQQVHNPIFVVPLREVVQSVRAEARPGDSLFADLDIGVHLYWQPQPVSGTQFILSDNWPAPEAALTVAPPIRVWLFIFGRDRTIASDHTDAIRAWLVKSYQLISAREYANVDPTYKALKDRLLGRDTYRAKLRVELYERR